MMNSLYKYGAVALVTAIVTFFLTKGKTEYVDVPFEIEVPIPVYEKDFDTIYVPKPEYRTVEVINTKKLEEYKKSNDSLKTVLYKESILTKDYKEVFEDSIQTITVGMNVTGTLNSVATSYITKKRYITVDTTMRVKVPSYKRSISLYSEVGMPTDNQITGTPLLKGGFDVSTKKNFVWGLSVDTEKRVWAKVGKKWNF